MTAVRGLCHSRRAEYVSHPRTCHLTKLEMLISDIYIVVLLGVIIISQTTPPPHPHALMESWAIT